jgi:hypothetical protein
MILEENNQFQEIKYAEHEYVPPSPASLPSPHERPLWLCLFCNVLQAASRLVSYAGDEDEDDEASKVKVSFTLDNANAFFWDTTWVLW